MLGSGYGVETMRDHFDKQRAYEIVREPADQTRWKWKQMVMNNRATPRAIFCLWLALWRRLATKERLAKLKLEIDMLCEFCRGGEEDLNYLLCTCLVVTAACRSLMSWFGNATVCSSWGDMVHSLCNQVKGKSPRNRVWKAVIAEFVYDIWIARNKSAFKGKKYGMNAILRGAGRRAFGRCMWDIKLQKFCESVKDYPSIQVLRVLCFVGVCWFDYLSLVGITGCCGCLRWASLSLGIKCLLYLKKKKKKRKEKGDYIRI